MKTSGTTRVAGRKVPMGDLGQRRHHPKCPTRPGQPLNAHTICVDCIYGTLAEKAEKLRS